MSTYNKIKRAIYGKLIQKRADLKLSEPVVSFTFDDVPDSGFINGGGILGKYGYKGTFYISLGLLDRADGPYFNQNLIAKTFSEGHEIGCHTFNHIRLFNASKNDVITDLSRNEDRIKDFLPGFKFTNFSYPYGEQSFHSRLILRGKYKSARGIKGGINSSHLDLLSLKAVALYENVLPIEKAFDRIDEAIRLKSWLIFYTHDVTDKHTIIGCTPDYFEKVVKYCSDKRVEVLTVDQVLKKIPHAVCNTK